MLHVSTADACGRISDVRHDLTSPDVSEKRDSMGDFLGLSAMDNIRQSRDCVE